MLGLLYHKYQVHKFKQQCSENAMYRTPNPINNAVAFLPIRLGKSQIKPSQTFYELKNCGIKIMCSILHHLFTSILLHSVISLSLTEQTGRGRFLHLTIKSVEHFSDGTLNKWVYYRWLWPSRAVLFHGQMNTNSVKWMKKVIKFVSVLKNTIYVVAVVLL